MTESKGQSRIGFRGRGRGRLKLLEGYVVVDFTALLAGPFGTNILSVLGATVIKIEPVTGEGLRQHNPPWMTKDGTKIDSRPENDEHWVTVRFLKHNAGKQSVAIDIKNPDGLGALHQIIRHADAFIHNFKPAAVARLHITGPELQAINSRLVYVALDGLGRYVDTETADIPVIDYTAQALSGVMALTGDPDGSPTTVGFAIGDIAGGIYAAIAVLAGLLSRDGHRKAAHGSALSVSMLGALSSMVWDKPIDGIASWNLRREKDRPGYGLAGVTKPAPVLMKMFQSADGKWLYLCGFTQDQMRRIVDAVGIADDVAAKANDAPGNDYVDVEAAVEAWVKSLNRDEARRRLIAKGVSVWPVQTPVDIMADSRFRDAFLYEVEHPTYGPTGMFNVVSPIVSEDAVDYGSDRPAPLLGQQTREVLRDLAGMATEEIDALAKAGVVHEAKARSQDEEDVD